jgi:hypothetical protein
MTKYPTLIYPATEEDWQESKRLMRRRRYSARLHHAPKLDDRPWLDAVSRDDRRDARNPMQSVRGK